MAKSDNDSVRFLNRRLRCGWPLWNTANMRPNRAISLFRRVVASLAIIALMAGIVNFPAMAAGMSPDCMAMMQSEGGASPSKAPDAPKTCPFAALCATAGIFIEPASGELLPVRYPVDVANFTFNESTAEGISPRPPARPPRFQV
jgi:hypothetical protein